MLETLSSQQPAMPLILSLGTRQDVLLDEEESHFKQEHWWRFTKRLSEKITSERVDLSSDEIFDHPLWLQSALKSIDDIAGLPPNWDGYHSPPLSPKARQDAISILKSYPDSDLPKPGIVPISGGGIQLEWRYKGRELELEIDPEAGELIFLKVYEDFTMEEDAIPVSDLSQAHELMSWLINGSK